MESTRSAAVIIRDQPGQRRIILIGLQGPLLHAMIANLL